MKLNGTIGRKIRAGTFVSTDLAAAAPSFRNAVIVHEQAIYRLATLRATVHFLALMKSLMPVSMSAL